jgi:hypothetical protein
MVPSDSDSLQSVAPRISGDLGERQRAETSLAGRAKNVGLQGDETADSFLKPRNVRLQAE